MDKLDAMRVFAAVAEARSFAAAARELRLSAPAVTRAVAALEAHLGTALLVRSTRQVRVTETGERFLADCRRILGEVEDAEAVARGASAEPRGELALTASVQFGRLHVAPLVLDFLARHPQMRARAFFADRIVNLVEEGYDLAVRIAHLPDSSLTAVRVGRVRAVVVASPDYLARYGEPQTPADLPQHAAVGFSFEGSAPPRWTFLPESGLEAGARRGEAWQPRIAFTVNAGDVVLAAAVAGHGLARALSYQVAADVAAGRLRIVLAGHEPPPIPVHLVYPAGRRAAAKVRHFVDFAAERLRADPALAG